MISNVLKLVWLIIAVQYGILPSDLTCENSHWLVATCVLLDKGSQAADVLLHGNHAIQNGGYFANQVQIKL
jgi:hypothetical protein